jgi:peptide/nickel transport system ATP-binding protein
MTAPYVNIENLNVTFTGGARPVKAVNGVDLRVNRGEVVALIGESGSGKSVTLRSVLRLHNERRTTITGSIKVGEQEVLKLSQSDLTDFRGKTAAMIFQEPLLALDPVYSVGAQIVESIQRHESVSADAAHKRALELFERVRIPSPRAQAGRLPARDVGRHAPTRHDCTGTGLQTATAAG